LDTGVEAPGTFCSRRSLNIPNEIRGLCIGAYVLVVALFGTDTVPMAVALVSRALGGETMLDQAIALVSAPSATASAICFGVTMRSRARTVLAEAWCPDR